MSWRLILGVEPIRSGDVVTGPMPVTVPANQTWYLLAASASAHILGGNIGSIQIRLPGGSNVNIATGVGGGPSADRGAVLDTPRFLPGNTTLDSPNQPNGVFVAVVIAS